MTSISLTKYLYCEHYKKLLNDVSTRETTDGVPIKKLFISNLAKRTTYKDLKKLFSKYGNVKSCFLIRNQGKSNFAFVTFDTVEPTIRARYDIIQLHNRYLRVQPADSWHQPDSIGYQYYNKDWQKSCEKLSNEQCNEDFIENSITENNIQILNDDCLKHIFCQLPVVDRVRIERVCKKWKSLSQESWSNVRKLDFSRTSVLSDVVTDIIILRKILLRCGRFLNEINLSDMKHELSRSTLSITAKLCPNLQRIDVSSLSVSIAGINSLTNHCHNITKLSLGNTDIINNIRDRDLQKLFEVNSKLRCLKIDTYNVSGSCLLYLPLEAMEEIILLNCRHLQEQYLSQAIKRLHNLKTLRIQWSDVSVNVIQAIGTYCISLKILQLSEFWLIEPNDMLPITQLPNLEVLIIYGNTFITDELLCNIASKCQQLTYLDISSKLNILSQYIQDCQSITNVGIAAVTTLQKLETLIMNHLINVTDIDIQKMCNLKKFECRACSFSDTTITELLASATQLELLDLTSCHKITNLTLKKAAAVTVNRVNNKVLKIFVGRTKVNLKKFEEVTPFLHIVNVLF
nr:F-box protein SKIP2-like isoform X1 [Nomia melanderi]